MASSLLRRVLVLWFALSIQDIVLALQFTEQPTDTIVNELDNEVIFKCSVDESSARIKWYKDNQVIVEDYIRITVLLDGLRIANVKRADSGQYYCEATRGDATIKSNVATLTVQYTCSGDFNVQASSSKVFNGDDVTLTCDCDGVPQPTYTWTKNGNDTGVTTKQLVITSANANDNGDYQCVANNAVKTVSSSSYNLAVIDGAPPKITVVPERKIIFIPKTEVMVNCLAVGDPKPNVFWYYKTDPAPLANTSTRHTFPNGSLHFQEISSVNAGIYKCQAENQYETSKFYESRLVQAKIGNIPAIDDQLVRLGSVLSVPCKPPRATPKVNETEWTLGNGQPIPSSSRLKSFKNTLTIEKIEKGDAGTYTCVAKNIAGEKKLDVKVTVAIYPKMLEEPKNQTVIEGRMAKFKCNVSGDPRPTIAWEKDNKVIERGSSLYKIEGSTLTIPSVMVDSAGLYRCSATLGSVSERSNVAELKVREKITVEKGSPMKMNAGTDGKVVCSVNGEKPWNVTWSKVGLPGGLLPHMQPGGHVLTLKSAKLDDTGKYTCHISNSFSSASNTISVNVYVYPVFVIKPKNTTVELNDSAMFNCSLTGKPAPKVIWYKRKPGKLWKQMEPDNEHIKTFSNGSLLLRNVAKIDELSYKCIGGNPGEFLSSTVFLTVSTDLDAGKKDKESSDNMGKTVGIAVGCAGAYIILVVGLMIYCKSRRAKQAKNKLVINGEEVPLNAVDGENVEVVKAPDSKLQFPRQDLEALRTLGSGSYGNVFLAKASEIVEGESTSIVVVQSLTAKEDDVKRDFMNKMEMLSLSHENIAKLLGVCRDDEPMYLISEYPEQGDLKTVMRDSSTPLTATQKLNLCASVASGMNYLTSHEYVHKDLAARNCLVDKCFNVKIAFLSLNQGTYPKEYYKRDEELIPLRWMAPEALEGTYDESTDVWSFAILVWEVYTEGLLPYEERSDEEVLKCVSSDLRLTKPESCPGKIFKMLEQCWEESKDRPTFGHLCDDFSEIPRDVE